MFPVHVHSQIRPTCCYEVVSSSRGNETRLDAIGFQLASANKREVFLMISSQICDCRKQISDG